MAQYNLGRVQGLSAYEVAVNNGYVGTEEEWLTWLKAKNGTEVEINGELQSNVNLLETSMKVSTLQVDNKILPIRDDILAKEVGNLLSKSKNLFNQDVKVGVYDDMENIQSQPKIPTDTTYRCFIFPVEQGKTYTFSSVSYKYQKFDFYGNSIKTITLSGTAENKTLTIDEGTFYLGINFSTKHISQDKFMIVEGTEFPSEYIPYSMGLNDNIEPSLAQKKYMDDALSFSKNLYVIPNFTYNKLKTQQTRGILISAIKEIKYSNTTISENDLTDGDNIYVLAKIPGIKEQVDAGKLYIRMYNKSGNPSYSQNLCLFKHLYDDLYFAEMVYQRIDGYLLSITWAGGGVLSSISLMVSKNGLIIDDTTSSQKTFYVSNSGNDDNSGTENYPLKTFQKAIDLGAEVIFATGGVYANQSIVATSKDSLKILVKNSKTIKRLPKYNIVIDNSILLETTTADKLQICNKVFNESSNFYKVFTTKELPIIRPDLRSESYNAILWECDNTDETKDIKLKPVLTLLECSSTRGTFYYSHDEGKIYINPTNEVIVSTEFKIMDNQEGNTVTINNVKSLTIENLTVKYTPNYCIQLKDIEDCNITSCVTSHSAYGGGFKIDGVNGNFYNCEAYKVCADGFGITDGGHTNYFDCIGHHCYDDGISHHNGCTGNIYGGEWYNNFKGGVAPAHGSVVNCHNVISHHNGYGFYVESDTTVPTALGRKVNHVGCVAYDNTRGISVKNYKCTAYNCKYENNTTPTIIADNEYSSLTML